MPMNMKGSHGEARYGYRVASRLAQWRAVQDDGDESIMVECDAVEDDEFFKHYVPTELRLRVGTRWMVYRTVARVSDTQFVVSGMAEIQT